MKKASVKVTHAASTEAADASIEAPNNSIEAKQLLYKPSAKASMEAGRPIP